jgi:hypothetical protein
MRQRREVVGDDKARDYDDHDDHDRGHRQRQVPLSAEGHPQLHAKLHAGKYREAELLRLRARQAFEQRVDSRLRSHSAHR